ncbi:MAG TPA: hypothetical protein VFK62_03250 [Gaiellaceae bacterium]|nr:hypothetical protein [Gaiellaceae bacterium]
MNPTPEPLRVRLGEERHAVALAHELVGLARLDVHSQDGAWEVTIQGAKSDSLVTRVLDAVRRTLADQPAASAQVFLDGHEYLMQGE